MPPQPAVSPLKVSIANQQEKWEVPFTQLKEVGRSVLEGEKVKSAKITVALMTDEAIHALNRRFLQHDEPTDVITFPLSNPGAKTLEADLAISTDTALRVAAEEGHPPLNEVALYLIHGLLHLCGFDDHDDADLERMRARERHYLKMHQLELSG